MGGWCGEVIRVAVALVGVDPLPPDTHGPYGVAWFCPQPPPHYPITAAQLPPQCQPQVGRLGAGLTAGRTPPAYGPIIITVEIITGALTALAVWISKALPLAVITAEQIATTIRFVKAKRIAGGLRLLLADALS